MKTSTTNYITAVMMASISVISLTIGVEIFAALKIDIFSYIFNVNTGSLQDLTSNLSEIIRFSSHNWEYFLSALAIYGFVLFLIIRALFSYLQKKMKQSYLLLECIMYVLPFIGTLMNLLIKIPQEFEVVPTSLGHGTMNILGGLTVIYMVFPATLGMAMYGLVYGVYRVIQKHRIRKNSLPTS